MAKYINNKKGMALALVLMVFAVVTIIATIGLSVSLSDTRQSVYSQNYIEASYLARSAVDVVRKEINKQQNMLDNEKDAINSTASGLSYDNNLQIFYSKIPAMNPSGPAISNVNVTGIADIPIVVKIERKEPTVGIYNIIASATYQKGERVGSAKIFIGKASSGTQSYSIPSFGGNNTIYTWGDITLKNGNQFFGSYLSCGGEFTDSSYGGTEHDLRGIEILIPPVLEEKNISLDGDRTLKNIDSGFYGNVNITGKTTWTVDTGTSGSSVTLVLNSLISSQSSDFEIKVIGTGNLSIYIKEDYISGALISSRNLLDIKNKFKVTSGIKESGGINNPQVYFIVYNDNLQNYYNLNNNITIPISQIYTQDNPPILQQETTFNDNLMIGNGSVIEAYIYAPYCNLNIKNNNPELYGSIYSASLNSTSGLNNGQFHFKPFKPGDSISNGGNVTTLGEPTTGTSITYNLTQLGVWIK